MSYFRKIFHFIFGSGEKCLVDRIRPAGSSFLTPALSQHSPGKNLNIIKILFRTAGQDLN
jgi:hypothetical protein